MFIRSKVFPIELFVLTVMMLLIAGSTIATAGTPTPTIGVCCSNNMFISSSQKESMCPNDYESITNNEFLTLNIISSTTTMDQKITVLCEQHAQQQQPVQGQTCNINAAVQNLNARVTNGAREVTLRWDNSCNSVQRYDITRCIVTEPTNCVPLTSLTNVYVDNTGLLYGKTYTYTIKAYYGKDSAGADILSGDATITKDIGNIECDGYTDNAPYPRDSL